MELESAPAPSRGEEGVVDKIQVWKPLVKKLFDATAVMISKR